MCMHAYVHVCVYVSQTGETLTGRLVKVGAELASEPRLVKKSEPTSGLVPVPGANSPPELLPLLWDSCVVPDKRNGCSKPRLP